MSVGEIIYRLKQRASDAVEQVAIKSGWQPVICTPVTTRMAMLDEQSIKMLPAVSCGASVDGLFKGNISLFDYEGLNVSWPIQWHRDPLTGTSSPNTRFGKTIDYRDDSQVGDIKVLWELGRQQFLVPIAVDYCVDQDPSKLEAIAGVLNSWIEQNPYGYGVHWCSSLEVAIRAISWSMTHQFLLAGGLKHGLFSLNVDVVGLQKQIYQHGSFIHGHLSLYSSANNHLIGELTGLHVLCSVFQFGPKSDRWKDFAWKSILAESTRQVFRDGVNKEQAIYYHCWVLEYFTINYLIAGQTKQKIPDRYVQQLSRMAQFIHDLSPMGMHPPQIGDADDGVAITFSARSSSFYSDLIETINALAEAVPTSVVGPKALCYQLLYKAGSASTPTPLVETAYPVSYPNGGYAVLGKPDCHVVFDCGSLGFPDIAAHGHADMLNICLAIDGGWWLVDPGTYSYHSEEKWRNYFRGSCGHNVLSINKQDQSQIGGPFMWVKHANAHYQQIRVDRDSQEVSGWHDGYAREGAPRVGRSIQVNTTTEDILILDNIDCSRETDVALHYHFSPEVVCLEQQDTSVLLGKEGTNTRIKVEFPDQFTVTRYYGDEKALLGWYSAGLGKKEPCLTLRASKKISTAARFTTRLIIIRER